jgi:hypothetical protein
MRKDEGMDLLKRHLGVEEDIIQHNFKKTNGCHIKYHELQAVYMQNKEAAVEAEKEKSLWRKLLFTGTCVSRRFCCIWCVVPFSATRARIIVMLCICSISRT